MRMYHGNPNPSDLENAKKAAPKYDHRAEYDPESFRLNMDVRYILDNGAYNCYRKNQPWDATLFIKRLNQIPEKGVKPDFVVLPDVVTNPRATYRRAKEWSKRIEYPTAYPCQDGVSPNRAVDIAQELECVALFIGGSVEWKRKNAESFVEEAHANELDAHIARPTDLQWADNINADSVDTTSIVRNQSWGRLEKLSKQQTQLNV